MRIHERQDRNDSRRWCGTAHLSFGWGAWVVTAPPDNVEPWKQKTCDEHVQQLDMLNRYKLFWSFVQRRQGFNDCLKRVDELGMKPPSE